MQEKDYSMGKAIDDETLKVIVEALRCLKITLSAIRMYPPGSVQITESLAKSYDLLSKAMEKYEDLTFSEVAGKILINGCEITVASSGAYWAFFGPLLADYGIKSLTLKRNLTKEELNILFENFTRKKQYMDEQGGLIKILSERGVKHIAIDERTYVEIGKEEAAYTQNIMDIISKQKGRLSPIVESLLHLEKRLGSVGTKEVASKMKKEEIDKLLSTIDSETLMTLLETELPREIEASDIKRDIVESAPSERVLELVDLVLERYNEAKSKVEKGESDKIELLSLEQIINKIVISTPGQLNIRKIKDKLKEKGLDKEIRVYGVEREEVEEVKETVTETKRMTLDEQVYQIISGDRTLILEEGVREFIPSIIRELLSEKKSDEIDDVLSRLEENLKDENAANRFLVVETFKEIFSGIELSEKSDVIRKFENNLTKKVDKERNLQVYRELMNLNLERCCRLIKEGDYKESFDIINLTRKHFLPEGNQPPQLRGAAEETLKGMVKSEMTQILLADLKSGIPDKQMEAMRLIALMDEFAVDILIDIIKNTEDLRVRRVGAVVLKDIGEKAFQRIEEELNMNTHPDSLRRLLEIVDIIGDGKLTEQLIACLRHPDKTVQRQTLLVLERIKACDVLANLIDDKDEDIRKEAIRILGDLQYSNAVPKLINMIESEKKIDVQEAIIVALAKIGSAEVVFHIMKIFKKRKYKKDKFERLRAAACWSLGRLGGDEPRSMLEKLSSDKNYLVQNAARLALEKIKSPT